MLLTYVGLNSFSVNALKLDYSLAAFHDAVIIYAHLVNETLATGGDIMDGRGMMERMKNRDYNFPDGMFDDCWMVGVVFTSTCSCTAPHKTQHPEGT